MYPRARAFNAASVLATLELRTFVLSYCILIADLHNLQIALLARGVDTEIIILYFPAQRLGVFQESSSHLTAAATAQGRV